MEFLSLIGDYICVAVIFGLLGSSLKINDLLSEHNFKWFKGGFLLLSLISVLSLILAFNFFGGSLVPFWLAIILSWILRGRIDCPHHGIFATFILLYVLFFYKDYIVSYYFLFITFFFIFSIFGIIHDIYQYQKIRRLKFLYLIFYKHQYIYWIISALIFSIKIKNFIVLFSVISFVLSYDFFYSKTSRKILKIIGIKPVRK